MRRNSGGLVQACPTIFPAYGRATRAGEKSFKDAKGSQPARPPIRMAIAPVYFWFYYREAGSYSHTVKIHGADNAERV